MVSIAQPTFPLPPPEPPPRCPRPLGNNDEDAFMADLPVLVEDVSLDEESFDNQQFFASISSAESYDDKLKTINDEHD